MKDSVLPRCLSKDVDLEVRYEIMNWLERITGEGEWILDLTALPQEALLKYCRGGLTSNEDSRGEAFPYCVFLPANGGDASLIRCAK